MVKASRKCIVHIGMHKTGSSSIQSYLKSCANKQKILYTDFGGSANQSEALYNIFSTSDTSYGYHSYVKRQLSHSQIDELKEKHEQVLISSILSDPSKDMVLSAEDLIALSRDSIIRLKDFLHRYFDVISVFGYIRPIRSYVSSSFQECVKHGQSSYSFATADPRYDHFLNYFELLENVEIIPYTKDSIIGGDVVKDFCHRTGLKYFSGANKERNNTTLTKESLSVLYLFLRFTQTPFTLGGSYFSESRCLIDAIKDIGSSKIVFSEDQYVEIIQKNEMVLEELSKYDSKLSLQEESNLDSTDSITSEKDLLDYGLAQWDAVEGLLIESNRPKGLDRNSYVDFAKIVFCLKNQILNKDEIFHERRDSDDIKTSQEYQELRALPINWDEYFVRNKVASDTKDPVCHYISHWGKESLVVGDFDTNFYLSRYRDVKESGVNPLIHFHKCGQKEGRIQNESLRVVLIGDGEIARTFLNFQPLLEVVVFAKGVSNSSSRKKSDFQREERCLRETIKKYPNHRFIYFSSCALSSSRDCEHSEYYKHKQRMEAIVSNSTDKYYILRLPQFFSNFIPGKRTLINFLFDKVKSQQEFVLNISAYRYVLHSDELLELTKEIVNSRVESGTYSLANFHRYNVADIVSSIESKLDSKAILDLKDEYDGYELDLRWLDDFIKKRNLKVDFSEQYFRKKLNNHF